MSEPILVSSLFCEDVLPSKLVDDKPTLYRVVFDWVAARFPARVARVFCVNFWQGGQGEFTGRVRVVAPSGAAVIEAESTFIAQSGYLMQVLHLPGLPLPEAGRYTVEVYRGEKMAMTYLVFAAEPAPRAPETKEN